MSFFSPEFYEKIMSFINHHKLLQDFNMENVDVVFSVIGCINAIFVLTPNNDKMALRNLIFKNEFCQRVYNIITSDKIKLSEQVQKNIKLLEYIVMYDIRLSVILKIDDSNNNVVLFLILILILILRNLLIVLKNCILLLFLMKIMILYLIIKNLVVRYLFSHFMSFFILFRVLLILLFL